MLVKGDSGLLNAHILIKILCNIPIHSKYVQFLLVPKYQYSLYHFKWCLYKLMTDLYCDQSEVTKNIINSFHLLSWFQKHPIEKHPRFYTFVQTCRLCVQSSGSHLATGFSSWCGWHQYNPVEMTFHSIVHCLCSCTLWIIFIWDIVRWWTFQMPISSLTFACMILCKTAFLRNTSSLVGI